MAAQTGGVSNVDAHSMYAQSFGNIPHKTVYQSYDVAGLKAHVDKREQINSARVAGLKAHSTQSGGAGTAGYAMVPVYVDPKIVDQSRKNTPLTELIPRVTNQGMTADYNVITAKGGAFTAEEDAALSETNTTYDRKSEYIKFLYAVGRVTGPSVASQPSYVLMGMQGAGAVGGFSDESAPNAMQQEVLVKARELKELEENLLINGNKTTSGVSGNPNGTEFDGIVTIMSSTNTVDKNTSALDLNDFHTATQYAFDDGGRPNLGVASSAAFTDLLKLVSAKIGYMQAAEVSAWGFSQVKIHTIVGAIPIIPSMFLSNTSGSKAIYLLDLSVVEVRVLQDMTYQELAQTNDSRKFMLKMYETLIIRAPSFCASITEIA